MPPVRAIDVSVAAPIVQKRRLLGSLAALVLPSLVGVPDRVILPGAAGAGELSSQELERSYDEFAGGYDQLDGGSLAQALGFPELRASLLSQASGAVLECAVGTGLNLPLYRRQQLTSLTAIDLSDGMLQQARRAAQAAGFPVRFQRADVASLPFADESFDTVVDTFSLCVFADPLGALREMARVVRPGGRVLLAEHTRSTLPLLGWYQDLTAGAVAATGKGCIWNQDVPALVEAAGLRVRSAEQHIGGLVLSIQAAKAPAPG